MCRKFNFCTWTHYLTPGPLHRDTAPVPSAMLLYLESKLVSWQLAPRFRQLAIKFILDGKNRAMLRSIMAGAWTLP
jgi:hypothetical protein